MAEKSTKPTTGKASKTKIKEGAAPVVEVKDLSEVTPVVESVRREELIATAAYFKAAQRGFEPGNEIEDWLAAEREFEASSGGRLARIVG